ncbi:hypothetical protein [Curtobacterium sp. NPDC092190]|uniref:hypothetical protein n=1 Tax=Curtobacterium sp. NPDC092190 TaxID=3363973 RepID=UPI003809FB77
MQITPETAGVAAGVVPVFLIALLLEQQRLMPSRRDLDAIADNRFEMVMWRIKQVIIGLAIAFGGVLEISLLSVVNSDGASGFWASFIWNSTVWWVTVPTVSLAFTMWDSRR